MRPTENKQVLHKFSTSSESISRGAFFRSYITAGSAGHANFFLDSNDLNALHRRISIDIDRVFGALSVVGTIYGANRGKFFS